MTEERAKKVLQEQIDRYEQEYDAEGIEALEIAIKALEQQPCEDCISREAVRRILANQRDELVKLHTVNPKDNPKADAMAYGVNWSLNTLMELPSVTPSYNSIKTELKPCEDCVSREALKEKKVYSEERHENVVPVAEIDWLPSVKPQRPKGKWIEQNDTSKHHFGWYYCSNCGAYLMSADGANYCSCCGAEMEDSND